jgi:hypothetical protein
MMRYMKFTHLMLGSMNTMTNCIDVYTQTLANVVREVHTYFARPSSVMSDTMCITTITIVQTN